MARVPVANPFRQSGSRSTTTTASSAKAAKKTAAKPPVDEWTEDDQANAALEGWGVFEIIDNTTHRLFYEIQLCSIRFDDDGCARFFVTERAKKDPLAQKAIRIVFSSKAGAQARTKK